MMKNNIQYSRFTCSLKAYHSYGFWPYHAIKSSATYISTTSKLDHAANVLKTYKRLYDSDFILFLNNVPTNSRITATWYIIRKILVKKGRDM